MKLSVSKVLDLAQTLTTKAGQELKEFLEFSSQLNESILRLAANGIALSDNVNCETKIITYVPGKNIYELFQLKNTKPTLILLKDIQENPIDNYFHFQWRFDGRSNKVNVYLKPTTELVRQSNVAIIIFY